MPLHHYPFDSLGTADHGWLKPHYHFSFSNYFNPARTGFGKLLVINDDLIAPHSGFPTHGHRDMEIITYVRSGAITHEDSMGNRGVTGAGDVQVMSAGSGIRHSEYNLEDVPTTLYQIWIEPHTLGVTPRWEARSFPKEPIAHGGALTLLVSGDPSDAQHGALWVHQDCRIHGGILAPQTELRHPLRHQAYVLISSGTCEVQGVRMSQGDGAEITGESELLLRTQEHAAEVVIIDVVE